MDTIITKEQVARVVREAIPKLACVLPADISRALRVAQQNETHPLACEVLHELCENASIAQTDHVPICQDTGTVWVSLEIGSDVGIQGDVFSLVDKAVADAYNKAALRKSLVHDALLDRNNTGNNTPAFCDVHVVDEPGVANLHIMLKGGGSDNASRVVMLVPGAGKQGIIDEVVKCVREKAPNACPPLIVGVGVGATFDKVGGLAKHALLRPVGSAPKDEATAAIEAELLAAVNATGLGAGGVGGAHTALAVHVETAPCHIAALPLAINMGCSAMRRTTINLLDENSADVQPTASLHTAKALSEDTTNSQAKEPIRLTLPLQKEELSKLRAGDICTLTGSMYTLRDAGHIRLLEELHEQGSLPYHLEEQTIFYAGPTPEAAGRPFGAVGPTTASRMDFAAPELYRAGIVATVGKGRRSEAVKQACKDCGCVYFASVGGAAAFLAKRVESSQTISYDDLGTEALRKIEVKDFPVFVGVDVLGNDVYDA